MTVIFDAACWCVQVITSGLKEETTSAGDCGECLTPAERLLPRRQPQPKPGEPQVQASPWSSHTLTLILFIATACLFLPFAG